MDKDEVLAVLLKLNINYGTNAAGEKDMMINTGEETFGLNGEMLSMVITAQNGAMTRLTLCEKDIDTMVVDVESLDFQKAYTFSGNEFIK